MSRINQNLSNTDYNIIEQIVDKQTIKVMDRYLSTDKGLPQGSSLSPVLFNHVFDEVISSIKTRLSNVRVVAYADDTAIIGTDRADIIEKLLSTFELKVNRRKSAVLSGKCVGYSSLKTHRYLGSRLKYNGTVIELTPLVYESGNIREMQNVR